MTNTIPAPLHALILLFVWSVLAARSTLLRFNNYDVRLTHALTFACIALTLKDPTVASVLNPILGPTLTRTLVHILILWSVAALVGVYNSWDPAEPQWKQPTLYCIATTLGVLLLVLSAPARAAETTVELTGGWQAVAYFAIYAAFTAYGLGRVTLDYLRSWKRIRTASTKVTVIGVIVFFVSMLVESLQMLAVAILTGSGKGERLVEAKSNSNGWLFAVMMLVAVTLSGLPFFRSDMRRELWDQFRIHRLWKTITRTEPDLVFGTIRDRRTLTDSQRQLRVTSEVFDVVQRLNHYAEPINDGRWDDQLAQLGLTPTQAIAVYQAAQLQNAIERRKRGLSPLDEKAPIATAPAAPDDTESAIAAMMLIAQHWSLAGRLRQSSISEQEHAQIP